MATVSRLVTLRGFACAICAGYARRSNRPHQAAAPRQIENRAASRPMKASPHGWQFTRKEPLARSREGAAMPVELIHPVISFLFLVLWAMIGQLSVKR